MDKTNSQWKKKTWEIRRKNTRLRERIALGNTKTQKYEGYATITDSIKMSIEEIKKHDEKHHANDFIDKYADGRSTLFVWVLGDVKIESNPKPYSFSTGSWCKLEGQHLD